jgi:hypothetical protein
LTIAPAGGEEAADGPGAAGQRGAEAGRDQGHHVARRRVVQCGVAEDRGVVHPAVQLVARDAGGALCDGLIGRVALDEDDPFVGSIRRI